ncbi:MAG: hypothetical protein OEZ32_11495 [Nitrospinota bacterium]|nr:hypothetical protein [Nitrospinota bacterium]
MLKNYDHRTEQEREDSIHPATPDIAREPGDYFLINTWRRNRAAYILLITLSLTDLHFITATGLITIPITVFYILLAALSPVLLMKIFSRGAVVEYTLPALLALVIIVNYFAHLGEIRLTTVIFSLMFIFYFFIALNLIRTMTPRDFIIISKVVIYLYLFNVVVSLIDLYLGIKLDIFGVLNGINYDLRYNVYRLRGFSSEPSYAAIIIATTHILYSRLSLAFREKKSPYIVAASIFMIIAFKSVYGYLLLMVIFAEEIHVMRQQDRYNKGRSASMFPVLVISGILFFLMMVILIQESAAGARLAEVVTRLFSEGLYGLQRLEGGTWVRLQLALDFLTFFFQGTAWEMIFGIGAGSASLVFGEEYGRTVGTWQAGMYYLNIGGWGYFLDYGIMGTLSLIYVFYKVALKGWRSVALIVVTWTNASFNTMLFWYVITCLIVIVHFDLVQSMIKRGNRQEELRHRDKNE